MNNEGYEGLFPFATLPPTQAGPWEWFDSTVVVTEAALFGQNGQQIYANALLTNPDMSKAKGTAYIDSVMGYLNPRIVYCLNLSTGISTIDDASNQIQISPNPVSDRINIDLNSLKNSIKGISIYDISGRKVKEVPVTESRLYSIERGTLTTGSYFVKIQLENGEVNKKIVIQ